MPSTPSRVEVGCPAGSGESSKPLVDGRLPGKQVVPCRRRDNNSLWHRFVVSFAGL
jgi:hypothetical protein